MGYAWLLWFADGVHTYLLRFVRGFDNLLGDTAVSTDAVLWNAWNVMQRPIVFPQDQGPRLLVQPGFLAILDSPEAVRVAEQHQPCLCTFGTVGMGGAMEPPAELLCAACVHVHHQLASCCAAARRVCWGAL
jgi:hypothetical protein